MNKILTSIILLFSFLNYGSSQVNNDLAVEILAIENGLLSGILIKGEEAVKMNINERMEQHKIPGASISIVKKRESALGQILWDSQFKHRYQCEQ